MNVIDELAEKYYQEHMRQEGMTPEWESIRRGHSKETVIAGLNHLCELKGKHYSCDGFSFRHDGEKTVPEILEVLSCKERGRYAITPLGEEVFQRLQTEGLVHEKEGSYSLKES